jgi:hypothetical protein
MKLHFYGKLHLKPWQGLPSALFLDPWPRPFLAHLKDLARGGPYFDEVEALLVIQGCKVHQLRGRLDLEWRIYAEGAKVDERLSITLKDGTRKDLCQLLHLAAKDGRHCSMKLAFIHRNDEHAPH